MLEKSSRLKSVALAGMIIGLLTVPAFAGTGVYVNGVELSPQQIALVYQRTGQVPLPGHYLIQNACVVHLESGQVACAQAQPGYGGTGGGYGDNDPGEPWFHRGSDYSGGYSVGGDGSGCIYTPNWSNC